MKIQDFSYSFKVKFLALKLLKPIKESQIINITLLSSSLILVNKAQPNSWPPSTAAIVADRRYSKVELKG